MTSSLHVMWCTVLEKAIELDPVYDSESDDEFNNFFIAIIILYY